MLREKHKETEMKRNLITRVLSPLTASATILCVSVSAQAADKKPNIVMSATQTKLTMKAVKDGRLEVVIEQE